MFGPYRAAGVPTVLRCPRCEQPALRAHAIGPFSVETCEICAGVFAARLVLDEIFRDLGLRAMAREAFAAGPPAEPAGSWYLRCPRCDELMNRRLFAIRSNVIVHTCARHGTWFEGRELAAVITFVGDA